MGPVGDFLEAMKNDGIYQEVLGIVHGYVSQPEGR